MSNLAAFIAYTLGPALALEAELFLGFVILCSLKRIVLSRFRRGSA